MRRRLAALAVAAFALHAQAPEKEVALGRALAAELRSHTTALRDPEVLRYVNESGSKLAAALPAPAAAFIFSVITDDCGGKRHEPLRLPGGYIFIPARLIADCATKADFARELAAAMAKEPIRRHAGPAGQGATVWLGGSPEAWCSGSAGAMPLGLAPLLRAQQREAEAVAARVLGRVSLGGPDFGRIRQRVREALRNPGRGED